MSPRSPQIPVPRYVWWIAALTTLVAGAGAAGLCRAMIRQHAEGREARRSLAAKTPSLDRRDAQYVSSQRCAACHPGEHASWHRTYHRTMTQLATPENIAGRFDGTEIPSHGMQYRVFRRGGEFWAEMPDPDLLMYTVQGGKKLDEFRYAVRTAPDSPVRTLDIRDLPRVERRVVMATGSHHYQTYWVPGDPKFGNLLQTLPLVYLIGEDRWIPREEAFLYPPNSAHMVTQWNHHCIRCHSTGGNPGLDEQTGQFATEAGELGISCEACHGPGEEHARANADPLRRYLLHRGEAGDPTIVNPARLDHVASSQVCGQCHGVYIMREEYGMEFAKAGPLYRPGEDLFKTRYYIQHPVQEGTAERQADLQRNPNFFRERWWDDGTILAGGREFTAMSASGCYQRGTMSCLSCHSMHDSDPADQVAEGKEGNAACTQCHREPQYARDIALHTHHAADSSGSECMNCHMPHTTYALFGALRSHQINVPRAAPSARYGTPNACNLCHLDQTLAWTQERLAEWYGHPLESLTEEQRSISAAVLWLVKGHAAQRIITVWHLGWEPARQASGDDWLAPFAAHLLQDPYGVVRYVAGVALRRLPGMADLDYDFLAAPAQWEAAADRVVDAWRGGRRPTDAPRRAILETDEGRLDEARLGELAAERDDRPVSVKE